MAYQVCFQDIVIIVDKIRIKDLVSTVNLILHSRTFYYRLQCVQESMPRASCKKVERF